MSNLAVCFEKEELYQDIGTVIGGEKHSMLIRSDMGVYQARRAVSCLIEPETGDRVLFCIPYSSAGYILAVLERKADNAATISVDGDLNLRLDKGGLSVTAQSGVALASQRKISLLSSELDVNAVTGNLTVQQMTFTGGLLQAYLEKIKLFASSLDSVLERLHQRVKRSYRFVEETDQVRAQNIDHRAEKLLNLRGKNAVINARELIKLDGEQIHVG